MSKFPRSALTVLVASAALGVVSLTGSSAAFADSHCAGAVGTPPVVYCPGPATTVPVPFGGPQTVTVGGQTVGGQTVGGQTVGPYTVGGGSPLTTPDVPVVAPREICYGLGCYDNGSTIATVPGQTIPVPSQTVPAITVPATTVPVTTVPTIISQTVPIPSSVPVPASGGYFEPYCYDLPNRVATLCDY